jgi:hypothetical protein
MEEADLVMRIQSQHTNVGCLQVLSRSQVTPELLPSRWPICKSATPYIHTYIHNIPMLMRLLQFYDSRSQ